MPLLLAAKRKYKTQYVEKKKTEKGEVRIYSEEHIKKRWKEKVEKIKKLEKNIEKLRKKYKDDLSDDNDAQTRALAALIGLIDNTAMRVGNDSSVEEFGTYGATTLKKKHATVKGSTIIFKFKGKKKVDQDLTLDVSAVVSEIKKLLKNKNDNAYIFEYEEGKRIRPKAANAYLSDFGVTAKDIRGFHANRLMKEQLKKTKDFDKALDYVAEEVGHEAKTLMNQYLDPALVKKHKKEASLILLADFQANLSEIVQKYETIVNGILSGPGSAKSEPAASPRERRRGRGPLGDHYVTSPFGTRVHPTTGNEHFHSGIDLQAKEGAPVYAFMDGEVTKAGMGGKMSGNRIILKHEDSNARSSYSHLSKVLVKPGDIVSQGEVIGEAGETGRATGPHLHFRLEYEGKVIDPTPHLVDRRVV